VVLELSIDHLWAIRAHAGTYPDECGLLLGNLSKDNKTLVEVMATENAWSAETAESFQMIDPNLLVSTNAALSRL